MVSMVLQSVGFEELTSIVVNILLLCTFSRFLLAVTFVPFGKKTGASKSPESVKLEPHHAEQTDSSKSPERLKLKRLDVTLTPSVTHRRRESSIEGARAEEPTQMSQQKQPTVSGSPGEEPAKKSSRQKWKDERELRKDSPSVSSGDPIKDALVETIKNRQCSCKIFFPHLVDFL